MKRFALLATLVSIYALAASSPLKAGPITETPAVVAGSATETPAVVVGSATETWVIAGPCDTFDCSRLPARMAKAMRNMPAVMTKAMRNMPGPMVKAMENLKVQDMKCVGGKCTIELPAGITPPKATAPCNDGRC